MQKNRRNRNEYYMQGGVRNITIQSNSYGIGRGWKYTVSREKKKLLPQSVLQSGQTYGYRIYNHAK